jgi:arabinosyltransferase C
MLPDINPIISGLTGAYTYAGHWSETPQYDERRDQALKFFLFRTSDDTRRSFLKENGINYIVAPAPFSFGHDGQSGVTDATHLGTVVVEGSQYQLIKVE